MQNSVTALPVAPTINNMNNFGDWLKNYLINLNELNQNYIFNKKN